VIAQTVRFARRAWPLERAQEGNIMGEFAMYKISRRHAICLVPAIAASLFASSINSSATETAPLAIKGYDLVAYFTEKRAMVGDAQYEYEWDGAVYRFASAQHLELFKADPDRYLPQYENWCAASVAKGEKVYGNPEWWLVVDGRLYLFGKPIGPGLMSKDPAAMTNKADANWPQVSQLPAPPVPDYMRVTRATQ
jgi:YHS domain-containing protein